MTSNPATLLAPVTQAFPKYGPLLTALASIIAEDPTLAPSPAPAPAPAPAPPPPPAAPLSATVIAGRAFALTGPGSVCNFDFDDSAAPYNTLRGYNAAHVYDKPGTYVAKMTPAGAASPSSTTNVTVVADTRPIVAVAANADLALTIARTTTPTVLLLPAGATYDITTPASISAAGITLRAAPGTGPAPRIRRIASAGVYSTIIVNAADVSIEGIEFDSNQPLPSTSSGQATSAGKVGIYALNIEGQNLLVRNCTFRNVDDGLHCQPQARGLVAIGCNFTSELRACGVYLDAMQNVALLGLTAAGSVCEHIVRLEGGQYVLVDGGDLANHDGKETIAIRNGDFVSIAGNTLRAWARISQGITAQPGIYCREILVAANHFAGLRPDGPWLRINPGSQSVVIDGNTFDVDAQQGCVAIQAPVTDVTLTNNKQSLVNGATAHKPLVSPFGNPSFTETGTD